MSDQNTFHSHAGLLGTIERIQRVCHEISASCRGSVDSISDRRILRHFCLHQIRDCIQLLRKRHIPEGNVRGLCCGDLRPNAITNTRVLFAPPSPPPPYPHPSPSPSHLRTIPNFGESKTWTFNGVCAGTDSCDQTAQFIQDFKACMYATLTFEFFT